MSQTIPKSTTDQDDTPALNEQIAEYRTKIEKLEATNKQLEDKLKKATADPSSVKRENEAIKKENDSLKEEIKKALQIHAANVKLKDKITKLEQELKIA